MALCARKEYCRSEMELKIKACLVKHPEWSAQASTVVESLIKDGFLDESRYARAFARDKSSLTGWGPVKVRMALRAKRLDSSLIEKAISEAYAGQGAQAKLEKLALAKFNSLKGDPYRELKTIRYCLSRGYDTDAVREILRENISED